MARIATKLVLYLFYTQMVTFTHLFSKKILTIILILLIFMSGAVVGFFSNQISTSNSHADRLRLQTGTFTRPLLLGEIDSSINSASLEALSNELENQISQYVEDGTIIAASVYLRVLNNDEQLLIHDDEQYHPASLSKLPLYMAYLKMSQDGRVNLDERGIVEFDQDYNVQEVKPQEFPVSGNEYSIRDLLEMMMRSSDNTSFQLLMRRPEAQDYMRRVFQDHLLPYPFNLNGDIEIGLTPRQLSRFLRSLYNATYIGTKDSEYALSLMTKANYKNGLMAGVGSGAQVAHKYGLYAEQDVEDGVVISRQLHDCGIVYNPSNPYILCIMTKSGKGELETVERVIAGISSYVYNNLPNKK